MRCGIDLSMVDDTTPSDEHRVYYGTESALLPVIPGYTHTNSCICEYCGSGEPFEDVDCLPSPTE